MVLVNFPFGRVEEKFQAICDFSQMITFHSSFKSFFCKSPSEIDKSMWFHLKKCNTILFGFGSKEFDFPFDELEKERLKTFQNSEDCEISIMKKKFYFSFYLIDDVQEIYFEN